MKKLILILICQVCGVALFAQTPESEDLTVKWEELTAPKFVRAVERSGGVCIIPLGVYEKHGAHLPLGTDMYQVRAIACMAAEMEYAVVFPPYYFSQINEARSQPGTICYSHELLWNMLEETCSELARNGMKKIILLSGHGGNPRFLTFFLEDRMAEHRDYELVLFTGGDDPDPERAEEIRSLTKTSHDGHAGESETSNMLYLYPELVEIDAAGDESGENQRRLSIPYGTTGNGFNWYASYPNHYMGDGSQHSTRLGELQIRSSADQVAELIRFMKSDTRLRQIMDEYDEKSVNPIQTKPYERKGE